MKPEDHLTVYTTTQHGSPQYLNLHNIIYLYTTDPP